MKSQLTLTVVALMASLSLATGAETAITLSGVHNCCNGCAKGITDAASKIKDVTVKPGGRNVMLASKSKSALKKAVEAILDAGYFGKVSGQDDEKSPGGSASASATAAAKPKMTKSATVTGLHLCCQKCADAVNGAVKGVAGVTECDVASKAKSFTVKGEFDSTALEVALQNAGFNGKIR